MRSRPLSLLWLASTSALLACSSAPPAPREPVRAEAPSPVAAEPAPRHAALSDEGAADQLGAKTSAESDSRPAAVQALAAPPPDSGPRMAAVDAFAYIYKKPAKKGLALGYIRMGTSVPLLSAEPVPGEGCSRGFYRVAPRGFACLDRRTTLNLEDPYLQALASVAPDPAAMWPYHYAFSNGAPMYSRVPTPEEQEKAERRFGPRGSFVQLAEWSAGHEELITKEPIVASDPVPAMFAGGKRHVAGGPRSPAHLVWRVIPNGSMLAYAKAFEAEGRVWLVTSDLMLVPADRVRSLRRSTFHGVMLGDGGPELPLAWNRAKTPKSKYRRDAAGAFVETGDTVPAKSPVAIAEGRVEANQKSYFELRGEPGVFVAEPDVTVVRARAELPSGVKPGDKWIEAKILPGTLTAYEGLRPVRSSLFSPGKGGVPVPGQDHTKYATTALGFFPLEWKDRTATMSNEMNEPKVLWFSDVPHIQYLRAPLAMHVAYWHEDFGNPKSAECVNVSPEDGDWLFDWTLPHLPEGWGGMRPGDGNGPSTPVVVTAR